MTMIPTPLPAGAAGQTPPGNLVQVPPFSDSVIVIGSDGYSNALQAADAVGLVTWQVSTPNAAFVVSPSGVLTTTSALGAGPYTISGTMSDADGNTGNWTFTLTVRSIFSPQSSITPVEPASPLGIEIRVPFQIDPATGGVAELTSYTDILAQHLLTILMTIPGERVNNPGYGAGVPALVFDPIYARTPSLLQSDLASKITQLDPAIQVQNLLVTQDPIQQEVLNITISYSVVPSNEVNTLTLYVGGGVTQVIS